MATLVNDPHVNEFLTSSGFVEGCTVKVAVANLVTELERKGVDFDKESVWRSFADARRAGYITPITSVELARRCGTAEPIGNSRNLHAAFAGSPEIKREPRRHRRPRRHNRQIDPSIRRGVVTELQWLGLNMPLRISA